ncbi:hypothetical protein Pen02_08000 [Plantactinospora endophytica]|uniref:Uncharacterized protein n=1 Tax=Plantactinospora endophytica TaxID=673535 RepID=A0ABQ4DTW3_9ACTN|nr:hypothetical protein Pen02_08000 [Plantactinospora endophytica]
MRFLIVRTDIRAAADDELAAAWAHGERLRDEQTSPEQRRQTVRADDRDAALLLARALSSVGAVRSGRQRVKVLPVGEPDRRLRNDPQRDRPGDQARSPELHEPALPLSPHAPAPAEFGPPTVGNPHPRNLGPQSRFG